MPAETPTSTSTSTCTKSASLSTRTVTHQESFPTSHMDDSESDIDRVQRPRKRKRAKRQIKKSTSIKRSSDESDFWSDDASTQIASLNPNSDLDDHDRVEEHSKEDLEVKSYAELKKMFTNPELRKIYGDDLLLATWKANLNRMTLDLLHAIDRDLVPEKFRFLIDEVIENKTYEKDLAALNAVADDAFHRYMPHYGPLDQEEVKRWREVEYREGRQVAWPPRRFRSFQD
ncbi:hypothetical protein KCU93_g8889, partial [Aureobasidium melanogenum]